MLLSAFGEYTKKSGYHSSFIVTQTDLFAAVTTGAPPKNLISRSSRPESSAGSTWANRV